MGQEVDRFFDRPIAHTEPPRVERFSGEKVQVRAAETDDLEFNELWNSYHGIIPAEVVSNPLDEASTDE